MKRLSIAVLIAFAWLALATPVVAEEFGDYYVTAPVLNERAAPVDGPVVNRVYEGQKLTVYQVKDGWARVTAPGYDPRWVSMAYLSREKPTAPTAMGVPNEWKDPRIDESGMPSVGHFGLTEKDIEILWRGANLMLDRGRCARVYYADKSVSKANTYYVNCGARNVFFSEADLYE